MPRGAWLAVACAAATSACSRTEGASATGHANLEAAPALAAPALSVRQMPALVPVRRPDGRPFAGATERMGHDTYDLECDGGLRTVTCDDFLGGAGKACPPPSTLAAVPWTNANLDCQALELIVHGAPSTISFLRTLSMSADLAGELPAALWQGPSPQANARLEKAAAAGKSLRDEIPGVAQTISTPERAKYESKDAWLEVIAFAFGDFGSPPLSADAGAGPPDGVEDVILEARSGPLQGSAFYATLWVLTRRSATGKLEIVRRF
ncbi:MAG TPA: hypothetical protein VLM85_22880 [Polyangiaceae bacterium]|nr:hypothetical protein [Polyangiaceae bacterium]